MAKNKKCKCGRKRPVFVFDADGCDFCRRNKARENSPKIKITLGDLRAERNRLLAECDWTQLADVPMETRKKWQPYRKKLRDVFKGVNDPSIVVFPTKPDEEN